MTRHIDEVLHDIRHFEPVDGNWLKLDQLLAELWETQRPESGIDAMLKVLERFPEEDGAGVFQNYAIENRGRTTFGKRG